MKGSVHQTVKQFKEHICDMDNSDNSIYCLNVDKITRDDESIGKRLKFSDESENCLIVWTQIR